MSVNLSEKYYTGIAVHFFFVLTGLFLAGVAGRVTELRHKNGSVWNVAVRLSVVLSLSEAPGFAILSLALPEGSRSALVSQRGDHTFLELLFGLWRQLGRSDGRALLHLR